MNTKIFGIFLLLIVGTLTIKFIPQKNHGLEAINYAEYRQIDRKAKLATANLKAFLSKNKDIQDGIQKKSLTSSQIDRLLKFIVDDPVYSTFVIQYITQEKEIAWIKSLSPDALKSAMKIIFKILLNKGRFKVSDSKIIVSESVRYEAAKYFLQDPEIIPAYMNSMSYIWKLLKNSQRDQKLLIKIAPQLKDVDFGNLTQDQKLKILKLAATHPNLQQ